MSNEHPETGSKGKRIFTRPWVVMPALAIVVLAGWIGWQQFGEDDTDAAAQVATDQTVEVSTGTMAETISAEGTVAVAESEDLSFTSAGTVTAVDVAAGQTVTEGQVLATIDSTELEATVAEAEASLADASAAYSDSVDAGASWEQLQADESAIVTAQDRLDDANEALAGAQLTAPFDGTVATVDITVGEELASGGTGGTSVTGSGSGSGQSSGTLGDGGTGGLTVPGATDTSTSTGDSSVDIQIVSTSSYVVELALDDTEITQVEVGQEAAIELSASSADSGFPGGGAFPGGALPGGGAFPGGGALPGGEETDDDEEADDTGGGPAIGDDAASVVGEVTDVAEIADASSGVATYAVTVNFEDATGDFNAGASVLVDITVAEVTDVVQVSSLAVTTTDGASTVTVVGDDGSEETRTVTTGMTSGNMIEITSGLEPGEQVLISLPGGGFGGGGDGPPELPEGVQLPTGEVGG